MFSGILNREFSIINYDPLIALKIPSDSTKFNFLVTPIEME